ncbi:MAG: biotin/lipoyl-binding protein [Deltaproteobacteria bacterium]|nr:biotin/lipoyl-binding protein [Deltaproteobacteria bacterium]
MTALRGTGGTLLVANRGEIAVRIIRTAQEMGLRSVAVYSDADCDAPHVHLADEAVSLGGSASTESYLSVEKLIQAAKETGAHAIHPGYGFLSENAAFARACADAGLVFVGPCADVIGMMGDKARAKDQMASAGVTVVPGASGKHLSDEDLAAEAKKIGCPLLVKATNGGGGRGMRVVNTMDELDAAMKSARREAENAFGDGTLLVEKYIRHARHIEVQVFADAHGNVVHLFERDCSVQRRRQKVIEEAPASEISESLRQSLYTQSVLAVKSVGYVGAGTLEFVVDSDEKFYFLEINTRLQVEHPVTECITGIDLVRWQLLVAMGEELPLQQDQIEKKGHAVEARLYAEDPERGLLPGGGLIFRFDTSALKDMPGITVHPGVRSGGELSAYYDPMVAKVVAHAKTRVEATRCLYEALAKLVFFGPVHNQGFLLGLLNTPQWQNASFQTSTLDAWLDDEHPLLAPTSIPLLFWQVAALLLSEGRGHAFSSTGALCYAISLCAGKQERTIWATQSGDGWLLVDEQDGSQTETSDAVRCVLQSEDSDYIDVDIGNRRLRFSVLRTKTNVFLGRRGTNVVFTESSPFPVAGEDTSQGEVRSPVAGRLAVLSVVEGQKVAAGDVLGVIEAMKMENRLQAEIAGEVAKVLHVEGDQVQAGELICCIVPLP